MMFRWKYLLFLLSVFVCTTGESAWGQLVIHTKTAVEIELKGYNGLSASPLFRGDLVAGGKYVIDTPYRGLALLVFSGVQQYPVIIGDETIDLTIITPARPPSFGNNTANDLFYRVLAGEAAKNELEDYMVI